jgi:hypothetical protein
MADLMNDDDSTYPPADLWNKYWLDFYDKIRALQKPGDPPLESYFNPPECPAEDEQPAAEDPELAAKGREDVRGMSNGPVVWEAELFTHSEKWGLIWRADFWDPRRRHQDHPARIVRWRIDGGGLGTVVSLRENEKLELKR